MFRQISKQTPKIKSEKAANLALGFSLIEIMLVVFIMAVLAAIAVPSYRQHTINQMQIQAQQHALHLADQLSRWKARRLSYAGFEPVSILSHDNDGSSLLETGNNNDKVNHATGVGLNDTRYILAVPLNKLSESYSSEYRYFIILTGSEGKLSLNQSNVNGNGWRMLITPNPNHRVTKFANSYYLDSRGQRCQYQYDYPLPQLDEEIYCLENSTW